MSVNILSIAGSDPSGGAGIQADLKTIGANGGYGMCVITALTAQNTHGVSAVQAIDPAMVTAQLKAVSEDVRIDAVKIGMLANAEVIQAVAQWLKTINAPVVLDPVMVATSGDSLLVDSAALQVLLGAADVVTPNVSELATLIGQAPAQTWPEVVAQAKELATKHQVLVLAKGGHLAGTRCPDALVSGQSVLAEFDGPRFETNNTHGTGCTLSSAVATWYARTGDWVQALANAKSYLAGAIAAADELQVGSGHGPVNHFAALWGGEAVVQAQDPMAHWWQEISVLRDGIDELRFIQELADGSLERARFEYYIAQDALYLQRYAQVLSLASSLAPQMDEQRFWANGAQGILEGELQLHRSQQLVETSPSQITLNYVNHLSACGGDYAQLIAAILPCYWIYQDIGNRLAAANHPGHPYEEWLKTYSSPEFDLATEQAISMVRQAWHRADPAGRELMFDAFVRSSEHELSFFAQAHAKGVEFSTA